MEEERKDLVKKLFDEAAEDGHLAKEAAKAVALKLEEEMTDEEVDTFFAEHDADKDGKITFEEFLTRFDKWLLHNSKNQHKSFLQQFIYTIL